MLCGYSGSGKSHIANILESKGWFNIALADKLKDEVSEKYSLDRKLFDTQEGKKMKHSNGQTLRDILIQESKKRKKNDLDYFTKKVIERIKQESDKKNVVISDMRFPHEYYFIKTKFPDCKIICARIKRDFYNMIDDYSEKALDNFHFDIIINNDETLMQQLSFLLSS